ncbi:MAG: ion transporter [Hyphomonas sp.]|uniref:ion transporter n=1 Tax=Hyphomonas sp. TaxID=87 RepID=UPI0017BA5C33|nr:ion transporter [Hyphomonas sp.]MBU3919703.1 ion transporter [Alphaproteobacteria bacterium]MBA3068386.1 ion transporter [Hyphomonas sp.]MBU4060747.1 ion transporter [Alphaproteobacteria bacterium]MBU4164731.1 ion transporter [Alphaproteobacteria bacterium]MBU4569110.1 ion transporter [Alphaproteobacteria bacterium]
MSLKQSLYEQLVPEARASGISRLNLFIVGVVLASFLFLALETEPTLTGDPRWVQAFAVFNTGVLAIFTLEYAARLWVAGLDPQYRGFGGRLNYMTRFYSVADLLAFAPELVVMALGGGGSLLVLRVLRLARLVKIARFVPAFDALGAALRRSGSQLLTSLAVALSLVYVSAVLLYFVEGVGGEHQEQFASIPRAIWWAVATLTTVGYGDVYPVTPLGRFFSAIIAIAGIGVVALPAGVFASAFSDELRERRERGQGQ